MLEYGDESHFNPRRRPTCGVSSILCMGCSHRTDVCSIFILSTEEGAHNICLWFRFCQVLMLVKITMVSALPRIYPWYLFSTSHISKAMGTVCIA